ncbi:PadR family transcriptional regulator [Bacillus cytotoxicus]|uniref:PadR family transcriptional regulator n=1 Tax=Bacillus cereus group sp. BfR-BA-01492 TaxID=2920361 RepID=UPI001F5775AD|nr:PadR family transcriptional regulator [Bacillus cereus group sp. BfR-BA-01492]EMA6342468.1 PadR family transcriptional regulator [Bacillus cytotoxicus]
MSVKHAILTLLSQSPRHRYDLKISFDTMVYNQWELNTGQIYTTIDRLIRDGFVEEIYEESESDLKTYRITKSGEEELHNWLLLPVETSILKDEFYFKLLCAKRLHYSQLSSMIKQQKESIIKTILQLQRLRLNIDSTKESEGMSFLIEGKLLHLEADLKWLDMFQKD